MMLSSQQRKGRQVRGKLVKRVGTVCTFECPQGHRSRRDYSKGPVHQQIGSETGMLLMERLWRDGISYQCKKCLGT